MEQTGSINKKGLTVIAIVIALMAVLITAGVLILSKVIKPQKVRYSRDVVSQAKDSIIGYAIAYKNLPATIVGSGAKNVDAWGNALEYFSAKEADNITPLNLCAPSGIPNFLTVTGEPKPIAFIVFSKGPNGTNDTGTGPFTVQQPSDTYDDLVEYVKIEDLRKKVCHDMRITTESLPVGMEEVEYPSTTLEATDGTPNYAWSVISGSLPPGLSLQTSGICGITLCTQTNPCICGTPEGIGSPMARDYTFTARVVDAESREARKQLTLTVRPNEPRITTGFLHDGREGEPYPQATLSATGGKPSYAWCVCQNTACTICDTGIGKLPPPLSLSGDTIIGTLNAGPYNDSYTFTVRVTDNRVRTNERTLKITVRPAAVVCPALTNTTPSPLPSGTVGSAYSSNITYTGGLAPVTCSIISGSLPPGLVLAGCTISGTPTTLGTYSFTTRVTDSCTNPGPQTSDKATSITVNCATLTNTTPSPLPSGTNGVFYSQNITYTGGYGAVTCSIASGSLPPGLVLAGCTISGTPTTIGTYNFTTRVTDSCTNPGPQTSNKATFITVNCAPFTGWSSLLPNATNCLSYAGSITVFGGYPTYSWSLTAGSLPSGISFCTGNTTTTCNLTSAQVLSSPGSYSFTTQVTDSCAPVQSTSNSFNITVNTDNCYAGGIRVSNFSGDERYYKKDGGPCTEWKRGVGNSITVLPADSYLIYSNATCTILYCASPITYCQQKPYDTGGDCLTQMNALCVFVDR